MPEYEIDSNHIVLESEVEGRDVIKSGNGGVRMRGRLSGGVRDKITMAEMKARMTAMWKDGELYQTICDTVSDEFNLEGDQRLKPHSIAWHIKNELKYWRETSLWNVDERQAAALMRIAQLEAIITEAYYASCEGKSTKIYERQVERGRSKDREQWIREEIASEREKAKAEGRKPEIDALGGLEDTLMLTAEKIKDNTRHEGSSPGDPRWTAQLIDLAKERNKLWGLYAKAEQDSADQELARLSDEERTEKLRAVLTSAIQRITGSTGNLAPATPLGGFAEGTEPEEKRLQRESIASQDMTNEESQMERASALGIDPNEFMEGFED